MAQQIPADYDVAIEKFRNEATVSRCIAIAYRDFSEGLRSERAKAIVETLQRMKAIRMDQVRRNNETAG